MVVSPITALPRGYELNEYRIESTLGIGGFGLTYLASDCNLNVKVAIKEASATKECKGTLVAGERPGGLATVDH